MGQLMTLCGTKEWPNCPVRDRIFAWQGDVSPGGQSIPLRLAGALHALLLQGNETLKAVYPPKEAEDDALWAAVTHTLVSETEHLMHWLDSAPQTNEVRRASTLIAVGHLLQDRFGLPIRTSELGASGGLNLNWDSYGLVVDGNAFGHPDPALTLSPDWEGPLLPSVPASVIARAGVDLNPLDPKDPDDALRLQAYLWPDQAHRMTLTKAAIAAASTSVSKGDAIGWLKNRLHHQKSELHLIYSTVAWQYFPEDKQELGTSLIEEAGSSATNDSPLAWFGMENDGIGPGAALTLRLWPGNLMIDLGRADFHGRWIKWKGM